LLLTAATISAVIAGLDPAIHHFCEKLDHPVSPLRGRRVMTAEFAFRL
jgi:hypothetical protein